MSSLLFLYHCLAIPLPSQKKLIFIPYDFISLNLVAQGMPSGHSVYIVLGTAMLCFGPTYVLFWRHACFVLAPSLPAYYGPSVLRFGITCASVWLDPCFVLVARICRFGKPIRLYTKPKLYFSLIVCLNRYFFYAFATIPFPNHTGSVPLSDALGHHSRTLSSNTSSFGLSASRRFGVSVSRRLGVSASCVSASRRFGVSASRRFDVSASRRFGLSAARHLGVSAPRRLGVSASRKNK